MLREMGTVRQVPGEPSRRWFSDRAFDKDEPVASFRRVSLEPDPELARFVALAQERYPGNDG
jgi:hypothetical protein